MNHTADSSNSKAPATWKGLWAAVGASLCILAVMAGSRALSSCGPTDPGLTRQQALYQAGTNVVSSLDMHHIAHNKVILIDGLTVITGSFNFTANAEQHNAENLLLVTHPSLAA